ncbi:hypothetical protein [Cupriavidus pampae]|uniref:Uncharacterized protein n=1 Tax=Cupriavidus pampae TaxID=659251 RepID=A0ABM8XVG9_9BURK|nr:hypothetical protein [Cupriavidus pampae]CAG9184379.1 hypothetical protein LMG32289_05601 [Cupriavidus pampae]
MSAPDTATEIRLFGASLRARTPDEYGNDHLSQTIPAVNQLSRVVQAIGNKLPNEAVQALFFEHNGDAEIRETHVELGLAHLDAVRNAKPDLEYLRDAKVPAAGAFWTAEDDEWLPKPPTPAP